MNDKIKDLANKLTVIRFNHKSAFRELAKWDASSDNEIEGSLLRVNEKNLHNQMIELQNKLDSAIKEYQNASTTN